MTSTQASGRAIASLVFGILGLTVMPCVGPIAAIILGAGEKDGAGRAGVILGWIALVLYAVSALVAIVFVLVGGTIVSFSG